MIGALKKLEVDFRGELPLVSNLDQLEALKVKYLGRKGLFTSVSGRIAELSKEEKKLAGQAMNRVKLLLEQLFADRESLFKSQAISSEKKIDTTMPGTFYAPGSLHPLTRVILDVTQLFERLGFSVVDGPEVETEYHNFEALNIPPNHPARDGFDTFYLENGHLLRSQTSTVQIRIMEKVKPPLKIIAPGKVYRPDATDATHAFMFHQIEGLMVDKDTSFADLKGALLAFAKEFFGSKTRLRFRPHFFPFTEPSAEVDIFWEAQGQWLEILGAGMVHPNVLSALKIDPRAYAGFAFGMGVERIAMLKYGVEDIRQFFENDVRFLRQFE
ncbi:MAG: phenylalanine--tRNA ligase subunit alpha [Candidatus Omnitrophica bacterium CG07_land_8_20_14_0_80_50_8]|nr:MAG: phenylalanine--tRNA ligase subunit alpha [Candidatus Omnitrophica bacterium CG07_land_8_20_14_0_80_50_8]